MFAWIRTPRGTHHCRHDMWAFTRTTRKIIKRELTFLVYCLNVYFSITLLESSFYFTNWSYWLLYHQHVRGEHYNNNNWHFQFTFKINLTSAESFTSHALCAFTCTSCHTHLGLLCTERSSTNKHEKVYTHPMERLHSQCVRCKWSESEIFSLVILAKPFLIWGWTIHNSAHINLSLTQYRTELDPEIL